MNLTQNDRLNQVTADALVVGVDIGSQEHFARTFDWRGFELSKRAFKFGNTNVTISAARIKQYLIRISFEMKRNNMTNSLYLI